MLKNVIFLIRQQFLGIRATTFSRNCDLGGLGCIICILKDLSAERGKKKTRPVGRVQEYNLACFGHVSLNAMFLISTTLRLWIFNQFANKKKIRFLGTEFVDFHTLCDLSQNEHKRTHTIQHSKAYWEVKDGFPLRHYTKRESDPAGCPKETLASFLFCVTTPNCPESAEEGRGRCCCEQGQREQDSEREGGMVKLHVKALVSAQLPIKTQT